MICGDSRSFHIYSVDPIVQERYITVGHWKLGSLVEMAAVLDEVGKSEEKLVNNRNVDDMDDIEGEDGATEASKKKKRKKKKKKAGKMW